MLLVKKIDDQNKTLDITKDWQMDLVEEHMIQNLSRKYEKV